MNFSVKKLSIWENMFFLTVHIFFASQVLENRDFVSYLS
jgi:hypothetical protein